MGSSFGSNCRSIFENSLQVGFQAHLIPNYPANSNNHGQKQSIFYQVLPFFTKVLNLNIHNFVNNKETDDFKYKSPTDGQMANGGRNKRLDKSRRKKIEKQK